MPKQGSRSSKLFAPPQGNRVLISDGAGVEIGSSER